MCFTVMSQNLLYLAHPCSASACWLSHIKQQTTAHCPLYWAPLKFGAIFNE